VVPQHQTQALMLGLVVGMFKNETMKTKFIISISLIFLLFNSCKKIREKVFSTRMEGKVIDMQTGKGIPNARLVVYEGVGYQGYTNRNYFTLKTFYADKDGNFKDKIKISFPEDDDQYESYFLKAEPDGYEKTEGTDCYVSNCNENVPYKILNLTKANKDMELKCNPEFKLTLKYIKSNINLSYLSVVVNLINSRNRLNYPHQNIENFIYSDTGNTYHNFYNDKDIRYTVLPVGSYKFKVWGIRNDSIIFKDSIIFSVNQNFYHEFKY
jgi:hypothetical protein